MIHGVGAFIGESKDDDARLVQDAEREDLAEVEIERQNDAGIRTGAINELGISGTLQPQRPDVNRFVAKLFEELNGCGRDAALRQKRTGQARRG